MSKQISFRDANGRRVSGCFEVSHGIITVIASDGRMKTADVDEAVLGPETLAKMLLLLASGEAIGRFEARQIAANDGVRDEEAARR